jgi:hypothetical protein
MSSADRPSTADPAALIAVMRSSAEQTKAGSATASSTPRRANRSLLERDPPRRHDPGPGIAAESDQQNLRHDAVLRLRLEEAEELRIVVPEAVGEEQGDDPVGLALSIFQADLPGGGRLGHQLPNHGAGAHDDDVAQEPLERSDPIVLHVGQPVERSHHGQAERGPETMAKQTEPGRRGQPIGEIVDRTDDRVLHRLVHRIVKERGDIGIQPRHQIQGQSRAPGNSLDRQTFGTDIAQLIERRGDQSSHLSCRARHHAPASVVDSALVRGGWP